MFVILALHDLLMPEGYEVVDDEFEMYLDFQIHVDFQIQVDFQI
jgi:hypothetical protein